MALFDAQPIYNTTRPLPGLRERRWSSG